MDGNENRDPPLREAFGSRPRTRSRPAWVYFVFVVYLVLAGTVTFGPFIAAHNEGDQTVGVTLIYAAIILACGLSLLVIPLGHTRERPKHRRPIWFPLVGSATLAMAVFFGLAIASHEYMLGSKHHPAHEMAWQAIWIALPVVWVAWVFTFWVVSSRFDRERFNGILYRTLVAGSVLELLIALPMHIVVRQRRECCGGIQTGIGVGIGLIVLVIAIGPAIFFLFYQRYRQAYARPRDKHASTHIPDHVSKDGTQAVGSFGRFRRWLEQNPTLSLTVGYAVFLLALGIGLMTLPKPPVPAMPVTPQKPLVAKHHPPAVDPEAKVAAIVEKLGGKVIRDVRLPTQPITTVDLRGTSVTDMDLKELAPLKRLTTLRIDGTKVTDAGLKELTWIRSITHLHLVGTQVTDEGLKRLIWLNDLTVLDLSETKVTDEGLKHLAPLTNLATLRLANTQVRLSETNGTEGAGFGGLLAFATLGLFRLKPRYEILPPGSTLWELAKLKTLSTLDLSGTKVTDASVNKLQKVLPGCTIIK